MGIGVKNGLEGGRKSCSVIRCTKREPNPPVGRGSDRLRSVTSEVGEGLLQEVRVLLRKDFAAPGGWLPLFGRGSGSRREAAAGRRLTASPPPHRSLAFTGLGPSRSTARRRQTLRNLILTGTFPTRLPSLSLHRSSPLTARRAHGPLPTTCKGARPLRHHAPHRLKDSR